MDDLTTNGSGGNGDGAKESGGPSRDFHLEFVGATGDYYFLVFKNLFLRIITLGIYHPWALVEERRFFAQHMHLEHEPFVYLGTPGEILRGFLRVGVWALLYLGVDHFIPRYLSGAFLIGYLVFSYMVFYSLFPVWQWFGARYRLSRTAWKGIRFGLTGEFKPYLFTFWKGVALSIVTLGFYSPFMRHHLYQMKTSATRYGDKHFGYEGDKHDEFDIYLKTFFLSIITLGIYQFWGEASLRRYRLEHTKFPGLSFRSSLTGGQLFWMAIKSAFLGVITLGFALPYIMLDYQRLHVRTTQVWGKIDYQAIAPHLDSIGAGGEVASDIFDIGDGLGF